MASIINTPTPLPAPRKIIAAHAPTGEPVLIDETTPFPSDEPQLRAQVGYIQPELIGKPDKAIEWAGAKPTKISHDDQISLRWVDIPPRYDGALHFTNTFDYLIVTHGELEMALYDGSTKLVRVGDAIVQIANIHAWNNKTDQWARFVGVVVPSEPVKVNGQGLEQPPLNGYHAQF
ncbi:hypothetical protein I316_02379 [Kwoniella heveanensis BCC8398]|uniref:Cupin 2 conserved barrel domain-containing protein n=1 Tax=Kwoniella heveanensis BCC8398 TaxID=1296120 RepID=A0A1B9GY46_9TREE|nr:hypothetical protein I316_02379 [Kwoniella heveanensis BCC8398]